MTVFLAMALGRREAAPSSRVWRPHMRVEVEPRLIFFCFFNAPPRREMINTGARRGLRLLEEEDAAPATQPTSAVFTARRH